MIKHTQEVNQMNTTKELIKILERQGQTQSIIEILSKGD